MKMIFAAILLAGLNAAAQTAGQPMQLPEGQYTYECVSTNLRTPKDSDVIERTNLLDQGKTTITKDGNQWIATDIYEDHDYVTVTITKTSWVDLGAGVFEETSDSKSTWTSKLDGTSDSYTVRYVSEIKVDGNQTINLVEKMADGTRRPLVGESFWIKKANGQVVMANYLREKSVRPTGAMLVSNNVCTYTLVP